MFLALILFVALCVCVCRDPERWVDELSSPTRRGGRAGGARARGRCAAVFSVIATTCVRRSRPAGPPEEPLCAARRLITLFLHGGTIYTLKQKTRAYMPRLYGMRVKTRNSSLWIPQPHYCRLCKSRARQNWMISFVDSSRLARR